jgi:hypothetical protein
MSVTLTETAANAESYNGMMRLQIMIDELSKRADDCDLVILLATSSQARRYNADLARELRDVVAVLKRELGLTWRVGLLPNNGS